MNEAEREHLTRLIAGVREQAEKEYEWSNAAQEPVIPPKWLDASILCDVVERDILNNK